MTSIPSTPHNTLNINDRSRALLHQIGLTTQRLFQMPMVLLAVVDNQNILLPIHCGTSLEKLPRTRASWESLVLAETPLIQAQASANACFKDFPFPITFFASIPIRNRQHRVIGSLCLIDPNPHPLEPDALTVLQDMALLIEQTIEQTIEPENPILVEPEFLLNPIGLGRIDSVGCWLEVNPALAQLLRRHPEELALQPVHRFIATADQESWSGWFQNACTNAISLPTAVQVQPAEGQPLLTQWSRQAIPFATQASPPVLLAITPMPSIADFGLQPRQFDLIVQNIPALVAYIDRNLQYQFCNAVYEEWFGMSAQTIIGKKIPEVLDDLAYARAELHIQKVLRGLQTDFENEILTLKGYRYVKTRYIPDIVSRGVSGFYVLVFDITEQKALEDQLSYEATHDPLTSLPNRRAFTSMLRSALSRRQRADRGLALMYIDLDEFKSINTRFNREYGDMVLQHLARFLLTQVRQTDVVARWGGDEFMIALEGLSAPRQDAIHVAEKIINTLKSAQTIAKKTCHVQCSIGISIAEKNQEVMADELLGRADNAMYRAKNNANERYAIE